MPYGFRSGPIPVLARAPNRDLYMARESDRSVFRE